MTDDEARDRFSAAFDGALTEDERAAFDKALAANPELLREYDEFSAFLRETQALAVLSDDPPIDFSARVQERIRARSQGRYFGDRFSRAGRTETFLPIVAAVLMLVLLAVCYWALGAVVLR